MSDLALFYAYPSSPQDLTETIEHVASSITTSGVLDIRTWRSLEVSGHLLLNPIVEAINDAEVFGCDLTYINDNVLFELGYAIGKSKRIWVSLNSGISSAKLDLKRLQGLVPVGYSEYRNRGDLSGKLYEMASPPIDLTPTVDLNRIVGSFPSEGERVRILYLKSPIATDASVALTDRLLREDVLAALTIDDPSEVPMQNLEWYVRTLTVSDAVIIHFLSTEHTNSKWHNAKCSFVAGIAHGLDRPLLMLAHAPFSTPLDYHTLLKTHATASACEGIIEAWLTNEGTRIQRRHESRSSQRRSKVAAQDLRNLNIGDVVAENEDENVPLYFVETSSYFEALNGRQSIFVGRKGTGKSANFLKVADELRNRPNTLVCEIKPVAYELEGVVQILKQVIERAERGFLVESIWKYLVYTQLAADLIVEVKNRPPHQIPSRAEQEVLDFVERNEALVKPAFSVRLENAIAGLADIDLSETGASQRARVSERLHGAFLSRLRHLLSEALRERPRVAILVDNLDKAWGRGYDVDVLSELIFGLLSVAERIKEEFQVSSTTRQSVALSLAVFLRADIFSHLYDLAQERDKLPFERLTWNDPEMLLNILDERLSFSIDARMTPEEIWEHYFTPTISNKPLREFIVESVLPRPRDIIFLTRTAIAKAINRRHAIVQEDDFLAAVEEYSQFALNALIAEDAPHLGKLESILYEFAGSTSTITITDVLTTIRRAGVEEGDVLFYMNMLMDLSFLGIVAPDGGFVFPVDEAERKIRRRTAQRMSASRGEEETFGINRVFHLVLQISN